MKRRHEPHIRDRLLLRIAAAAKEQPSLRGVLIPEYLESCEKTRSILFRFQFEDWMKNSRGIMHGGMICAMLDNSVGNAVCVFHKALPRTAPAVSLKVQFINPVLTDAYVSVLATVTAIKSRLAFGNAVMFHANAPDQVLAAATGQYRIDSRYLMQPPQS